MNASERYLSKLRKQKRPKEDSLSAKHRGLWMTARAFWGSNFRFKDSDGDAGMAMGTERVGAWRWVSSTVSCCNSPAKTNLENMNLPVNLGCWPCLCSGGSHQPWWGLGLCAGSIAGQIVLTIKAKTQVPHKKNNQKGHWQKICHWVQMAGRAALCEYYRGTSGMSAGVTEAWWDLGQQVRWWKGTKKVNCYKKRKKANFWKTSQNLPEA